MRRLLFASVAVLGASAASGVAAAQPSTAVVLPPIAWGLIGEGVGLAQGGKAFRATVAHLPRLGLGVRVTNRWGVEGDISLVRDLDPGGASIQDPRPKPSSFESVTATIVAIRGSRQGPFASTFGLGAGAYRESGGDSTTVGIHLNTDTQVVALRFGTVSAGFRIIFIPTYRDSRFTTFGLTAALRSYWVQGR
jgi:hypothetical protein